MSFGNFQKDQEGLPSNWCSICHLRLMSDEAMQLHRIWHAMMAQNEITDLGLREIQKQLEKNRAFGTAVS